MADVCYVRHERGMNIAFRSTLLRGLWLRVLTLMDPKNSSPTSTMLYSRPCIETISLQGALESLLPHARATSKSAPDEKIQPCILCSNEFASVFGFAGMQLGQQDHQS